MLSLQQKEALANKIMDLGNIALGSLVLGAVMRTDLVTYLILLIGLAVAVLAYGWAITLIKKQY